MDTSGRSTGTDLDSSMEEKITGRQWCEIFHKREGKLSIEDTSDARSV